MHGVEFGRSVLASPCWHADVCACACVHVCKRGETALAIILIAIRFREELQSCTLVTSSHYEL